MSKFSVPILLFALVFSLFSGLYLSENRWDQGPAASARKLHPYQPALIGLDVEHLKAGLNRQEPVTVTLGGLPCSKGGRSTSLPNWRTSPPPQRI